MNNPDVSRRRLWTTPVGLAVTAALVACSTTTRISNPPATPPLTTRPTATTPSTPSTPSTPAPPTTTKLSGTYVMTAALDGPFGLSDSYPFSPDSSKFILAGTDQTKVDIWDTTTGTKLVTLSGHTDDVSTANFSPDGTKAVTGGLDNTAIIWNAATGGALTTLTGPTNFVYGARFSPDGTKVLITSRDDATAVWDVATGKKLASVLSASTGLFTPDGTRFILPTDEGTAIHDATTGELLDVIDGSADEPGVGPFSPDGKLVVTFLDKAARVFDISKPPDLGGSEPVQTFTGDFKLSSVTFSPDGREIITTSLDRAATIWDMSSGMPVRTLHGHTKRLYYAEFSRDGSRIVTASADGTAIVWDAATGQALQTLTTGRTPVGRAMFSPDGRHIVTVLRNQDIIWTLQD